MVWRTNIDSQPATDLDDLSETAMQALPQVKPRRAAPPCARAVLLYRVPALPSRLPALFTYRRAHVGARQAASAPNHAVVPCTRLPVARAAAAY